MDDAGRQAFDGWFDSLQGRWVSVVLAGRIIGGRYGESPQTPRAYSYAAGTLRIEFATTELLTVERPSDVQQRGDGSLIIPQADSATFGWHYYGRPQTPENWCEMRYRREGDKYCFEQSGPIGDQWHDLTLGSPLVELEVGSAGVE